jgi:hypothetical protein
VSRRPEPARYGRCDRYERGRRCDEPLRLIEETVGRWPRLYVACLRHGPLHQRPPRGCVRPLPPDPPPARRETGGHSSSERGCVPGIFLRR